MRHCYNAGHGLQLIGNTIVVRLRPLIIQTSPTRWSRPRFSSNAVRKIEHEQVTLPSRDGGVTFDIYRPAIIPDSDKDETRTTSKSAIVHLTRISGPRSTEHDPSFLSRLSKTTNLPTIRLSYRLNSSRRFPLPLHDVTAGYDWVVRNILNSTSQTLETQHSVFLHATDPISSSLALALALTECRAGPISEFPARIAGVAATNAVVDWASLYLLLYPSLDPPPAEQKEEARLGFNLSEDTKKYFEGLLTSYFYTSNGNGNGNGNGDSGRNGELNPQTLKNHIFDPFASPILFFRTTGMAFPTPDLNGLADFVEQDIPSEMLNASHAASNKTIEKVVPTRKYHRRHPPASMGDAKLPFMRLRYSSSVSAGSSDDDTVDREATGILRNQGTEFVKLVCRAVAREEVRKTLLVSDVEDFYEDGHDAGSGLSEEREEEKKKTKMFESWKKGLVGYEMRRAERRVRIVSSEEGEDKGETEDRVDDLGQWFNHVLLQSEKTITTDDRVEHNVKGRSGDIRDQERFTARL